MSETMDAAGGPDGLQTNEIPVSDNVGAKVEPNLKSTKPERPSTRDSVRQALEEATKEPKAEDAPVETEEQKAERLRNEKGQFAKAEVKPEKTEKPEGETKTFIEAPSHWLGEDKIAWKNVPHALRQTIIKDQQALQEARQTLGSLEKVLTPQRRQALQQSYGSDLGGLDSILQTVEFSNRDPRGFIKWFADQYRIPLNEFTQAQPQVDPQAQQLQQYLQPVLEPVLSKVSAFDKFLQDQEAQKQQQMLSVVQSFENDSTNHPYFKDVEDDVLALLGTGKFKGTPEQRLKAAYEAAVWSNEAIRNRLIAERTQTQQRQQSQVADQKKTLAASVTGAPGTAKPVANGAYVKETPRDSVRRALEQAGRV